MSYKLTGVRDLIVQEGTTVLVVGEVAERGEGLQVDAQGIYNPPTQDDRAQYDNKPSPFGFLAENTGLIYYKNPDGSWADGYPYPTGGGGGGDVNKHIHNQGTPATTWLINHALNGQPSVTLIDIFDRKFEAEWVYTTNLLITVTLTVPTAGTALLIL